MVFQYFANDTGNEEYKNKKGKRMFAAIKAASINILSFGMMQISRWLWSDNSYPVDQSNFFSSPNWSISQYGNHK